MKRILLNSNVKIGPMQHGRGLFSYFYCLTWNIINIKKNYHPEDILLYIQINDWKNYKQEIFNICFQQNVKDFIENKNEYHEIEEDTTLSPYPYGDPGRWGKLPLTQENREEAKEIIDNYFKLKQPYLNQINSKISSFNLSKTIGIHRRATDSLSQHNKWKKTLTPYFNYIDNNDHEHIFLMCDNQPEINHFKKRYGNKIICFEDGVTSESQINPFFKSGQGPAKMKTHIEQMIINTYILSKTSKLLCSFSNVVSFASLLNPSLEIIRK